MKKLIKKLSAVIIAMLFVFSAVTLTACGETGDNSGSYSASNNGSSEPVVVAHTCTQKCSVCGGCLDDACTESACSVKCGAGISTFYTFEAENPNNVLTPGSRGPLGIASGKHAVKGYDETHLSNFSANIGGGVTYTINAEEATTATLRVSVSRCTTGAVVFSNVVTTLINYEDAVESACIVSKSRTNNWFDFAEFNLGCIKLQKGENVIQFISCGTNFNFDYIRIFSSAKLTYASGDECDSTDTPLYFTYPDLIDPDEPDENELEMFPDVYLPVVEDGAWTTSKYFDTVIVNETDGTYIFQPQGLELAKGCSRQFADNRLNERGVGAIGSLSGNKGRMVTFYITSDKDCQVALYGEFGFRSKALLFGNAFRLIVNGTNYTSSAPMPKGGSHNPSNTFTKIGYVNLKKGTNTITFMVNNKTNDYTPNIYSLRIASQDATFDWGEVPQPEIPQE